MTVIPEDGDAAETDRGGNTGLNSLDRTAEFFEIFAGMRAPPGKATVPSYLDTLAHLDLVPEFRFSANVSTKSWDTADVDDDAQLAAADFGVDDEDRRGVT